MLVLTEREANGLLALAGEGAEGLLNDADASKGYIGSKKDIQAARDALNALSRAITSVPSA